MKQSKSQATKLARKQKRCQAIVSKEIGLKSSDAPTRVIAVCNAGLSTGLDDATLLKEIIAHGNIVNLLMLPNKSYCFFECPDIENSQKIFNGMNGIAKLGQSEAILYLSYFESMPIQNCNWKIDIPDGLTIIKDFVSQKEEIEILSLFDESEDDLKTNLLKHRFVKHYGYEFLYGSNKVDPDKPLERKIPTQLDILWDRLDEKCSNLNFQKPEQLTVNVYKIGQGIPPHVDTHSAFLDPIISLSLEDDVMMDFRKNNNHCPVLLPRRSLLIMSGECRYEWTHGIRPRVMDIIPSINGNLTVRKRNQRTSLTFRKLRRGPCDCTYETFCDSKREAIQKNKNLLTSTASKVEMTNVHIVYDKIAQHFSETRHSPWPKVAEFIQNFEKGDVLLDVGCGNGKYLNVSSNIMNIGCDRSTGLLQLCVKKKFNVFKCDCLSIPFRNKSVNGCISIAVIHHLATEERRLQAIKEMARILIPKGKALIYVWAKNQSVNSKKSSYLLQSKTNKKIEDLKEISIKDISSNFSQVDLPIHKNRTEFKEQDVLVPWKLKNSDDKTLENKNEIYLRYYHVFEENELENLCKQIDKINILQSYYDQGNWCVIFEKLR